MRAHGQRNVDTNSEHIWGCCIIKEPETVYVFLGQSSEENTKNHLEQPLSQPFYLLLPPLLLFEQDSLCHLMLINVCIVPPPPSTELHKTAPSHSYRVTQHAPHYRYLKNVKRTMCSFLTLHSRSFPITFF